MSYTIRKLAVGLVAGAILAGPAVADNWPRYSTNIFGPPHIYVPPVAGTLTLLTASPDGIPYRWKVVLGNRGFVNFAASVGAKSASEPTNPPATPGWTHTSNWVALTLTSAAVVTIQVGPGAPMENLFNNGMADSDLFPAISIYSGQDTTSAQDHTFNPTGNGWWSTIRYGDNSRRSDPYTRVLTYKRWLPAGEYTVNIGGAAALTPQCDAAKPCYNGFKSYQARIATSRFWND